MNPTGSPAFALPGRSDRHRFFIDPITGRLRPLIQGGDGPNDPPGPATAADLAALQQQIDAAKNSAVDEAKRQAYIDALAKLGVTDLDQAAQLLKAKRDADAKNNTELENAQAEVERLKGELATAQALANTNGGQVNDLVKQQLIEHALLRKGVTLDAVATVAKLVTVGDITPDNAVDTVTAAVEATATTVPQLFTAAPPAPKPGQPIVPPTPPGQQATGTVADQAKAEAQRLGWIPANNGA